MPSLKFNDSLLAIIICMVWFVGAGVSIINFDTPTSPHVDYTVFRPKDGFVPEKLVHRDTLYYNDGPLLVRGPVAATEDINVKNAFFFNKNPDILLWFFLI